MDDPDRADSPAGALFRPLPGEDGSAVAARVAAFWTSAGDALAAVIGARGVAVMFQRAVHLAAARHPALGDASSGASGELAMPALQGLLATQSAADAAAIGNALVETMTLLLQGLVGASLTERLLRNVKQKITGDPPPQDTSA